MHCDVVNTMSVCVHDFTIPQNKHYSIDLVHSKVGH